LRLADYSNNFKKKEFLFENLAHLVYNENNLVYF